MSEATDEPIPWILRHAAERRGETVPTNGHSTSPAEPEVSEPASEAVADAPVSKFRRVSGATTTAAPTTARRAAPVAVRTYTPPVREWDSEVETIRPEPQAPEWTPPPSRPSSPPEPSPYGPSSYAPPPRKKTSGGLIAAVVAAGVFLGAAGIGGALLLANSSPSKAEFVSEADDVCRPANGPVTAIVKATTYPELAASASTLATATETQLVQLRALDLPGGAAKTEVTAVFAAMEGTGSAARRLQDAAGRQDDAATITATKEMSTQASDARAKAGTAGFGACAIGMQSGTEAVFGGAQSVIRAGFIAQADVLCRRAADSAADVPEPTSQATAVTYLNRLFGIFDTLLADIKALPVPPGDEATVSDILAAQDKVAAKGDEAADAARAGQIERLDAIDIEIGPLTTAADAKWDAYGLGSCGTNFGIA